jgi:polyribonucleotide nucleotidyltransferase
MSISKKTLTIGSQELTFETGKIARQAGGAVWLRVGDTVVFGTACMSPEPKEDIDFLPLRVDYQEKFSAAGKTLGGFIKREGRPTERETLVCRLIDRPIRPMLENGFYHDTQLLAYVWSYDGIHRPDVLAICAASAALVISEIPLIKPIGAVRVGRLDGQFVINPTKEQMEASDLDLVLAGTEDAILMIEGYCDFLTEEQVLEAIEFGHKSIQTICHALAEWQKEIGKPKKRDTLRPVPEATHKAVAAVAESKLIEAMALAGKQERADAVDAIRDEVIAALCPDGSEHTALFVKMAFKKLRSRVMRRKTVDEQVRPDGRTPTDIRQITIEQGILPRTHGSSLFTRGETQAMAVVTLGGETMAQRFEDLHEQGARRFYLQYSFPPFSVGEVGRMGAAGRREVGHGKLAERALQAALPTREAFPYVIRIESNITESNGSSSMASVCGGCLAMMEAGVPIKRPVAGIAMGLILEENKYTVLSDILGVEDFLGDMDFKITGDKEGITAFQMDIKVEGITHEIMTTALMQAKQGRIHILEKMLQAAPEHKKELSAHAPRIETVQIHPSKIGTIIGPGGKQIRAIVDETGVQIDIDDDGLISLASADAAGLERAMQIIEGLTADIEVGRIYNGKVAGVVPFGLFVEVLPGKEGLCHVSELDEGRVEDTSQFAKVGDPITVKVLDINERGQIKLSRKATLVNS